MKHPIVRLICEGSYCEAHIVRQIGPTGGGRGGVILVGILIWFAGPQRGPTRQTLKNHLNAFC